MFDEDLDFNELDFFTGADFTDSADLFEFDNRYLELPRNSEIEEKYLKYEYAEKLAKDLVLKKDCRFFVLIAGSFYFGDFLEAIILKYGFNVKRLLISTLSLNQNNVDSLAGLLNDGCVQKLDLIVSTFFFGHERHKHGLVPYLYEHLDKDNKFQLAAARTHCKIAQMETTNGIFLNFHGSANLRTSGNLEQFCIEENEQLYKFNERWQDEILEKYKTIEKGFVSDKYIFKGEKTK